MTRLLHVTTVADSLRFLRGQVGYMKTRGYDISIVSSPSEDLEAFGAEQQIAVHAVTMERRMSPFHDLASLRAMVPLLGRIRPDIVHGHTPKGGLLAMLAGTLARSPVKIYHMRGLPLATATGARRTLLTSAERVSCALADRVICVSHSLRDVALELRLCSPTRMSVLAGGSGNGVDSARRFNPELIAPGTRARVRQAWKIPSDAVVCGFVGRIVVDKGILDLLDAWERVTVSAPDAYLVIGGEFESRDAIPDEHKRRLLSHPRIRTLGLVHDVAAAYAGMDLFVLPTYREGFPNVLLEAGAMELPVVATRVTGCTDAVVDEVTGTFVECRDPAGLARALERYVRDPDRRAAHGKAGRRRVVSEFAQERIWSDLHALYERLLDDRRRGAASR